MWLSAPASRVSSGRFRQFAQHEVACFLRRASDLHRNPQGDTIWPGPQGARQFDGGAQLSGVRSLEVDAGELDHRGHRHMAAASHRQHRQNAQETVQQESGVHLRSTMLTMITYRNTIITSRVNRIGPMTPSTTRIASDASQGNGDADHAWHVADRRRHDPGISHSRLDAKPPVWRDWARQGTICHCRRGA